MTSANSMSILKGWGGYAAVAIARFRALAPYALIELVLPGGSVMALLLWLYRRRKNGVGFGQLSLPMWWQLSANCDRMSQRIEGRFDRDPEGELESRL